MKRSKDEDKVMGPMFPRLHVNDTEKGGPRAPPRNKMALYEQFMIPSHRYNSPGGVTSSSNTDAVHAASTSQFQPSSVSPHAPTKPQFQHSGVATPSILAGGEDQRNKPGVEDDFTVPIFSQSEMDRRDRKAPTIGEKKTYPKKPTRLENQSKEEASKRSTGDGNHIQKVSKQSSKEGSIKSSLNLPEKKMSHGASWQDIAKNDEHQTNNRLYRSNDTDVCLQRDKEVVIPAAAKAWIDTYSSAPSNEIGKSRASSRLGCNSMAEVDSQTRDISERSCRNETHVSLQRVNMDGGDSGSQASVVDSMPGTGISPDDVVGLIGLKHFWKARRAFVNQQRVFAVQVFELHRLIKVQKLIAKSPDILLEGSALGRKFLVKGTSIEKHQSNSGIKRLAQATNKNNASHKPHQRLEGTAENAVVEPPVSSIQNPSQHLTGMPISGNSATTALTANTNIISWCFPQPTGQQWLVPMMSPSEGLVYKPYSGPAIMSPIPGGFGPLGAAPMVGNFFSPGYNFPAPYFHEGTVGPTSGLFHGPSYFPPYGSMPVMNQASASNSMTQNGQYQASCSVPGQKDGAVSSAVGKRASKGCDRQGSTASSPVGRAQTAGVDPVARGGSELDIAATARSFRASEGCSHPCESDQPSKVIKVVPRNPTSASESATRILRSIQEERRQNQSN